MTDHLPDTSTDCARFETHFGAYLERELPARDLAWMDAHRASCTACDRMAHDVASIVTQAGALTGFAPSRDLWSGIAERIEAPVTALPVVAKSPGVVQTSHNRPGMSIRRFAIAATMLVAVSSAVTWRIATTRHEAVTTTAAVPSASDRRTDSAGDGMITPVVNADVVYEQQIVALRAIVDQRFRELDSTTVKELRRNLDIIDKAIADSKAALAKDPNSRVISGSLDRALANKLSLMRRVALL